MQQGCGGRREGNDSCNVVVLSRSPMVAEALAQLVGRFAGVAAAHGVIGETLAVYDEGWGPAHLVLIETSSPDGIHALAVDVRSLWPGSRIILVGRDRGPWCERLSSDIGAVGWLSSAVTGQRLAGALDLAHVAGRLPDLVLASPRPSEEAAFASLLTARELQVLRQLVAGHPAEEIAQRLDISSNTVRTHVQNILRRLDVHSQFEALMVARRAGLRGAPTGDLDGSHSDREWASAAVRVRPRR